MIAPLRAAALAALQSGGLGAAACAALERAFGPVEAWWASSRREVLGQAGLSARRLAALLDPALEHRSARGLESAAALGYRLVAAEAIPALANLPDPPLVLLVKGRLPEPDEPTLAVVGARHASSYGLRTARRIAGEVAAAGVVVASGLARGIDGAAHEAALDAGGSSIAVLGCGPDIAYPPEHRRLQQRLEAEGAVLSEHLPGTPPLAHHFPRRNRILVAMAAAVLVVEARLKSGTLTSVRWAADLGRDVLAIPGPIDSPLSEGPVQLLREGCTPIGGSEHVLEALGLATEKRAGAPRAENAAPAAAEQRLLALLAAEALDLDQVVRFSGEAPGQVLTMLLSLEVAGRLVREDGMRWRAASAE